MKVYTLEVTAQGAERPRLRVEASGATTLDALHALLAAELRLEPGRGHGFYRSHGEEETSLLEGEALEDARHPPPRLDRLGLRPGAHLLHVHDHDTPERHEVRVRAAREEAGDAARLEVLARREPEEDERALARLAAELEELLVESEIEGDEEDDELDDELDDEHASWLDDDDDDEDFDEDEDEDEPEDDEDHPAARELAQRTAEVAGSALQWCRGEPARLERLGHASGYDVEGWLQQVPLRLQDLGAAEEGADLAARAAPLLGDARMLAERAWLLAELERHDEAVELARDLAARFPDEIRVCFRAGETLKLCGDLEGAEALFQRALRLAGERPVERSLALECLRQVRVEQGRDDEAEELFEQMRAAAAPLRELERIASSAAARHASVGRNAPCPCGSGKKHKRCCGASGAPPPREGELLEALFLRMAEFAGASPDFAHARGALARFAGEALVGLEPTEAVAALPDEDVVAHFWAWLLLDWRLPDGSTWTQRFLQRKGRQLGARERALLERLGASHLGLYRSSVRTIAGAPRIVLNDLLQEIEHVLGSAELLDPRAPEEAVVVARIVELDGKPTLPLPGLAVPVGEREALVAAARARFEDAGGGGELREALRSHGHVLARLWMDAFHRDELARWARAEAAAAPG